MSIFGKGMKLRASQEHGLAILEVLVGGFILTIGILGIALMFGQGQSYVIADGDDRVAVALAQEKIEHVRSLGFACIPVQITTPPANTVMTVVPGCSDTADAQAARTYNETAVGRFASRLTRVQCADPADLTPAATGCSEAKIITVEVTPTTPQARGVRAETVVTVH